MAGIKMTNHQKVKEFNRAFQLEVPEQPQPQLFVEQPALVQLKLDLIKEEVRELEESIRNQDLRETVDALADILYVVYGAGISFGIDMDQAFDLVHRSNMSKLCPTEQDAIDTVKWYHNEFLGGKSPYDSPAYRKNPETGGYTVYNQSTGKILKSITYSPVNLDSVL